MRRLYINSQLCDIDDDTAIGIDYQAYDLKEPGRSKTKISNTFSIPKTANNLFIFGNPDNPQSHSTVIYDQILCDYWMDNYQIIKDGIARVESIDKSRINLYVAGKNDIWDSLKSYYFEDFVTDYIDWLENVKGVSLTQTANDNLSTFLSRFNGATEDIILPFYYSQLLNPLQSSQLEYWFDGTLTVNSFLESKTKIFTNVLSMSDTVNHGFSLNGGHFCIYLKSIFEFLEYRYSVNFCTSEVGIDGNIWDDAIAPTLYTPSRTLKVFPIVGLPITGYYLSNKIDAVKGNYSVTDILNVYFPIENVIDKENKTVYELITAFFQKFNASVEEIVLSDTSKAYLIFRFDDIKTLAPVVNFSNKISSIESFKNNIEGYAQHNYIKYKEKYPEASELFLSKDIVSLNKNAEAVSDLIEIDEYIPSFKSITNSVIPDLSIHESFKTFQFFKSNGQTSDSITIKTIFYIEQGLEVKYDKTATLNLDIPVLYDLSNEYLFLEEILEQPKVYTIKKWLSLSEVFNLKFFAQYWVQQLGGCFYINKITGFNPQKSNEPTTIELIKISNKTPNLSETREYYTDGNTLPSIFTDGNGNYFY